MKRHFDYQNALQCLFCLVGLIAVLVPRSVLAEDGQSNAVEINPSVQWNTFMGSQSGDECLATALDTIGNVYVTGYSFGTWGTPIHPHAGPDGYKDVFVAKLNNNGALLWHTFLGVYWGDDEGVDITVDPNGNIYVTGWSTGTWGSPLHTYTGGVDVFVAKLDSKGTLLWNTFLGSEGQDKGAAIIADKAGNALIAGDSSVTWGSPVNAFHGDSSWSNPQDSFVAKLNGNGVLQWNTFLGSTDMDVSSSIAVDLDGGIYVTGESGLTWGSPMNPYGGFGDVFASKLNSSGTLLWNTFMGSSTSGDKAGSIAVDSQGNVYVTGSSQYTWGSPLNNGDKSFQAFIAKLNNAGTRLWNTFTGLEDFPVSGSSLFLDGSGNIFVTGTAAVCCLEGLTESLAFCNKLSSSGNELWQASMGASGSLSYGFDSAVDSVGNIYVAGMSNITWGAPINAHAGGEDGFVAKLTTMQVDGFTQKDLAGIWYLETFGDDTLRNAPLWGHVKITVDDTGTVSSGTIVNSAGYSDTLTGGSLIIEGSGQISGTLTQGNGLVHSIPYGKLDAGKTFFSLVKSAGNFRSLVVGVKGGGSFSQADLMGTWYLQTLNDYTSTNAPIWGNVVITIGATGQVISGTIINSSGGSGIITGGSLIVDNSGRITGTLPQGNGLDFTIPYGKLDAGKTIFTLVKSAQDYQGLVIGTKSRGGFTQADLAGTWYLEAFSDHTSANSPQWGYGIMSIDGSGKLTGGSFFNSLGLRDFAASGSFAIDSYGRISGTMTEGDGYIDNFPYGNLDAGKSILTLVDSGQDYRGGRGLVIMIKSQAPLLQRRPAMPWLELLLLGD